MRFHFFISLLMTMTYATAQAPFVTVQGHRFYRADAVYVPFGMNLWYGPDLGATAEGRARLDRELDRLAALGINNLRVMAASEGPDDQPWRVAPSLQPEPGVYREAWLRGLDYLLVAMAERDMTAVLVLGNFWPWSGGFGQYVSWATGEAIPYPPPQEGGDWLTYQLFASRFFQHETALAQYRALVHALLTRRNTLSGQPYRDDPTIMAWQLANEPRGLQRGAAYRRWIRQTATLIHALAPQQLVSIGSEGRTPSRLAGTHCQAVHRYAEIDYVTCHVWPQNWEWYDPTRPEATWPAAEKKVRAYLQRHVRMAQRLDKPLVVEEFGLARDGGSHADSAATQWRERYYALMMEAVQQSLQQGGPLCGLNFWAWGGEGRPDEAGGFWQVGDDLIGDPPHEHQGWYAIYHSDRSTLQLLREGGQRLREALE